MSQIKIYIIDKKYKKLITFLSTNRENLAYGIKINGRCSMMPPAFVFRYQCRGERTCRFVKHM